MAMSNLFIHRENHTPRAAQFSYSPKKSESPYYIYFAATADGKLPFISLSTR